MANSYSESNYPHKLVAFLDILGFKDLVMQDREGALQTINSIDGHLKHVLKILADNHGKTFSTKLFSDCICVSCEDTFENMFYIIYELAFIQLYFSLEGIFLRGDLSKGNHFENDRMIFSKGLIKAYELEQAAIYPRIIIDKDFIDQIKKDNDLYFPVYIGFMKQDFLIQSPDGQFFIDYLNLLHEEGFDQIEFLQKHRKSIIDNVNKNLKNIKIIDKYRWIAEYHNYKFNEIFDADEWEKDYATTVINETTIHMSSVFPYFKKEKFGVRSITPKELMEEL